MTSGLATNSLLWPEVSRQQVKFNFYFCLDHLNSLSDSLSSKLSKKGGHLFGIIRRYVHSKLQAAGHRRSAGHSIGAVTVVFKCSKTVQ